MKRITYAEFLKFWPCYLDDPEQKALMDSIARRQEKWTALDILGLEEIPDEDKLWVVLSEELIEPETLHELACRCAERALSRVENPDPRSIAAIAAKRAWMRGEITDAELKLAEGASMAAAWDAARDAARGAARAAARAAARDAARDAARGAAWNAARNAAWAAARAATRAAARDAERAAAWNAARAAAWDAAWDAARDAERAWQVETLTKMLKEAKA